MRNLAIHLSMALVLSEGNLAALAQDIDNGERIAQRWCVECHSIDNRTGKTNRAISFATIAEKPGINSQMITSFMLMPHATMPNHPLSQKDAQDIAAFIMKMKR